MLKEIVVCDKCGKDIPIAANERHTRRISLLNGETSVDVASGRTDEHTDELEFCASCLVVVCRIAIHALSWEQQKFLLARVRGMVARG